VQQHHNAPPSADGYFVFRLQAVFVGIEKNNVGATQINRISTEPILPKIKPE
jgi:hypothetical protein